MVLRIPSPFRFSIPVRLSRPPEVAVNRSEHAIRAGTGAKPVARGRAQYFARSGAAGPALVTMATLELAPILSAPARIMATASS